MTLFGITRAECALMRSYALIRPQSAFRAGPFPPAWALFGTLGRPGTAICSSTKAARTALGASELQSEDHQDEHHRVLFTVSQIPEGRVSSFGRIAAAAGLPRKARWIGRILSQLPAETSIPWHRVLGHGGNITCPRRDIARTRLLDEGVVVENFTVKMRSYVWPESSDTRSQTKHRAE